MQTKSVGALRMIRLTFVDLNGLFKSPTLFASSKEERTDDKQ